MSISSVRFSRIRAGVPDYMLVGHAVKVVHAARNTLRLAALTGRLDYVDLGFGMMVSMAGCAKNYGLRDGYHNMWGVVCHKMEIRVRAQEVYLDVIGVFPTPDELSAMCFNMTTTPPTKNDIEDGFVYWSNYQTSDGQLYTALEIQEAL